MTRICLVLAAAFIFASSAIGTTIVVRPGDMHGWDVETNRWGLGYFTSGGVIWDETTLGFPSGQGAFYAITTGGGVSTSDKTPDSVWLGLDTFNGQPLSGIKLSQIKTLRYTAYVSDMPTSEPKAGELKYPREPICLQFVVQDSGGNRRNLWFRPWSNKPQGGGYGGNPADQMAQWITYDCIACTPQFQGPWATITPCWSEPITNQTFHSWQEVCAVFGDWSLVPTAPVGDYYHTPGWDNGTTPTGTPTGTATGMALNFEVGARKFQYSGMWGSSGTASWYPESINFKGYLDTFTLGIDYGTPESPNVVENTFDFEPAEGAKKPQLVALNMASICQGTTNSDGSTGNRTGYAAIWESSNLWKFFRTRLFGRILPSPAVYQSDEGTFSEDGNLVKCTYFTITDGSAGIPVPITVRVRDPDGSLFNRIMWSGDFVGISGDVRRKPWGLIKMRYIWSCAGNVDVYTGM
jgi:hypothetical protein